MGDREMWAVPTYVALIAGAEASVAFGSPLIGAIAYSVVLVVMLTHCAVRWGGGRTASDEKPTQDSAHAVAALAFLPVIRLVSMSAPVGATSEVVQSIVVAGSLLPAIAWAAWGVRLPAARLRPRWPALDFVVVWLGFPVVFGAHYVLRPESVAEGAQWTQLGAAVFAVSLAALVEEFVFRGFIQSAFFELYGSTAPLWATIVYMISYLGVQPVRMIALAGVLGLLFGWLVQRSQSLLGVSVSHALINVGLFVLLPAAPSGVVP